MKSFDEMNVGWRHLIWAECSMHPDFPFKVQLHTTKDRTYKKRILRKCVIFNPKNVTIGSGVDQNKNLPSFWPIGQKMVPCMESNNWLMNCCLLNVFADGLCRCIHLTQILVCCSIQLFSLKKILCGRHFGNY